MHKTEIIVWIGSEGSVSLWTLSRNLNENDEKNIHYRNYCILNQSLITTNLLILKVRRFFVNAQIQKELKYLKNGSF